MSVIDIGYLEVIGESKELEHKINSDNTQAKESNSDFHLKKMFFLIFLSFISTASALPFHGPKNFGFQQNNISIGNNDPVAVKVIGGNDAEPGEFPFQVSLQITPSSGPVYHKCGAIIYDEYHIISAAHCVIGENLTRMEIVAGAHNIKDYENSQQRIRVKRAMHHPQYQGNVIKNDIAVITVASKIAFSDRVQPLQRLAIEDHDPIDSSSCVTIGWGSTGQPGVVPDALQKVTLNIVNRETCRKLYSGINNVDQSMICAGGAGDQIGSCTGDSGGPILCSDLDGEIYMAGIVSWTVLPCGQLRFPTVFSNVAFLRPFLNTELARP